MHTNAAGNSDGAVSVGTNANFTLYGGHIQDNTATNEGSIINSGSAVNGLNAANGGGVYLTGPSTRFIMRGGAINDNHAVGTVAAPVVISGNGGGIHVHDAQVFLDGGEVTGNTADDGGGLFVPHPNLSNVTIDPSVSFAKNTAHNGIRIDNALAAVQRSRINPGKVSLFWTEEVPAGTGIFVPAVLHAFTNYDINSDGSDPFVQNAPTVTLLISNTVTGEMGEMNREFHFTVYFYDEEGNPLPAGRQFPYSGSAQVAAEIITSPDGLLTLDERGSASFTLMHGQTIGITSVPSTGSIQVVEATELEYRVSFTHGKHSEDILGSDTVISYKVKQ